MCGQMAGDPASVVLLLGMNIDELSMSPFSIPEIKMLIRHLEQKEMQKIVQEVMQFETPEEISLKAKQCVEKYFPEILQFKF